MFILCTPIICRQKSREHRKSSDSSTARHDPCVCGEGQCICLPVPSGKEQQMWDFSILEKLCKTVRRRGTEMFTKRIIPCLDVNNGRVVKGVNFVNLKRCRRSGGDCQQPMIKQVQMNWYFWISRHPADANVIPLWIWCGGLQRMYLSRLP